MRVLVTGGNGHLGRTVVRLLRQDGHRVRVLARLQDAMTRGSTSGDGPRGTTTWAEWLAATRSGAPRVASMPA